MDWMGWVTFGVAVLGATLGVGNFVWMIRRDAVRFTNHFRAGVGVVCAVEVVNLSYFAVTIDEVCLILKDGSASPSSLFDQRAAGIPCRLDARSSVVILDRGGEWMSAWAEDNLKMAFASTACGVKVKKRIVFLRPPKITKRKIAKNDM